MHSETDIPKDLCVGRREFPLKVLNKRVNVCTYQDRIRVDGREFLSFSGVLPFVRHEVLRQMEILRNASNSTYIVNI